MPEKQTKQSRVKPFQLWVNVDGKRATTILSLRVAPQEFQKAMKSKQNNPILLYCNNVKERITEFYANSSYIGIIPTPQQIIDFVKCGFAVNHISECKLLPFCRCFVKCYYRTYCCVCCRI